MSPAIESLIELLLRRTLVLWGKLWAIGSGLSTIVFVLATNPGLVLLLNNFKMYKSATQQKPHSTAIAWYKKLYLFFCRFLFFVRLVIFADSF